MSTPSGFDAPPPGYVSYEAAVRPGPAPALTPLRLMMIVSLLVAAVAEVGNTVVLALRSWRVGNLLDGQAAGMSLQPLLTTARWLNWIIIASVVVNLVGVVTWSGRLSDRAVELGNVAVKPTMARWGWVIPIGQWWLPFTELRKVATGRGDDGRAVARWQTVYIVRSAIGLTGYAIGKLPAKLSDLHGALIVHAARHGALAVCAVLLAVAMARGTARLGALVGGV